MQCRTWFEGVLDVADERVLVVRTHEELPEREGLLGEVGIQLDVVDVAIRELLVVQPESNDGFALIFVDTGDSQRVVVGNLRHEQLTVLLELAEVRDLEALGWLLLANVELVTEGRGAQAEDSFTAFRHLALVAEEVRIVSAVGLGILERYGFTIGIVVLPEVLLAENIAAGPRVAKFIHLFDVRHKRGIFVVESKNDIIRLLHEELLHLVDAMLKELRSHLLLGYLVPVALHEGKAEPLGAEALLLKENSSRQFLKFLARLLLFVFRNIQGLKLVMQLP